MRHLPPFLSTFGSARAGFKVSSRQKWGIYPCFCLLSVPRAPIFREYGRQKSGFPLLLAPLLDNSPVDTGFSRMTNVRFLRFARKWQSSVTYNVLFWNILIHGNKNRLFGLFPSWKENCHAYEKKSDDLQLIANHSFFQFNDYFSMIASVAVKFSSDPTFVWIQ